MSMCHSFPSQIALCEKIYSLLAEEQTPSTTQNLKFMLIQEWGYETTSHRITSMLRWLTRLDIIEREKFGYQLFWSVK